MQGHRSRKKRKNILVVGASSYVAQFLCNHLHTAGHTMILTYSSKPEAMPPNVQSVNIDFAKSDADTALHAAATMAGKLDAIVNCVGMTSLKQCEDRPDLATVLNEHVPAMCAAVAASTGALLVNLSTDKVYGGSPPFTENSQPAPPNGYGKTRHENSKHLAFVDEGHRRFICFAIAGKTKLRGERATAACPWHVNLRLSVVYGPPAPRTGATKFLQFVDDSLAKDHMVPFFEDERLNFVWVGDVVRIIEHVILAHPSGVNTLNVGGPQSVSRARFAQLVAEVRGYPLTRVHMARRDAIGAQEGRGAGVVAAGDTTMVTDTADVLFGLRRTEIRAGIAKSLLARL